MAILAVKPGVQPPQLWIMVALANVAQHVGFVPTITVTSGCDGTHSRYSKHGQLAAIDIRTKNFASREAKRTFQAMLTTELGPDYDVLLEQEGKPNEHLHVEFDPK